MAIPPLGGRAMKCAGCFRELKVGDRYIEDTASGFTEGGIDSAMDALVAGIFGGSDDKIRYCEDCTESGGDHLFKTVYGDEDDVDFRGNDAFSV